MFIRVQDIHPENQALHYALLTDQTDHDPLRSLMHSYEKIMLVGWCRVEKADSTYYRIYMDLRLVSFPSDGMAVHAAACTPR